MSIAAILNKAPKIRRAVSKPEHDAQVERARAKLQEGMARLEREQRAAKAQAAAPKAPAPKAPAPKEGKPGFFSRVKQFVSGKKPAPVSTKASRLAAFVAHGREGKLKMTPIAKGPSAPIQTSPKGAKFYVNKMGNKIYVK